MAILFNKRISQKGCQKVEDLWGNRFKAPSSFVFLDNGLMLNLKYGMLRIIFLILSLVILTSSTPSNGYTKTDTIYIGILPYYAPDKIWLFYRPFIAYLNKVTGLRWDLRLYHNYDAMIDGACKGEVSIAYMGPNPLGIAYERCKIKPLLVVLGEDGKPYYRSIIFTNDKRINSLKELKGKTFAFGDHESTSSYIIPRKIMEDNGITMQMIRPLFLKSHEKIIEAVAKNEAQAGATKVSVFRKFKGLGLKILLTSEPLPHHSFCSAVADKEIEERFKKALLKLKPLIISGHRDMVKNWDPEIRYGFAIPSDDYIQRVLKLQKLYKK